MSLVPIAHIDSVTKNELQPPCEITICEPVPAELVARFRCGECGHDPHQFMCLQHFEYFAANWPARCTGCGIYPSTNYFLVSVEHL